MTTTVTVNVNDVLFKKSRFSGLGKVIVTKITPSGNIRVSDGALLRSDLRKKTSDSWDTTMYYAWSQALEDEYRVQGLQQQLSKKLKELNVYELNEQSLKVLLNALNEI